MGSIKDQLGPRRYFDTNPWIYFVEQQGSRLGILDALFGAMERYEIHVVTSELTLAEAVVTPIQTSQPLLVDAFRRALRSDESRTIAPVGAEVLLAAAAIRAKHNLKLPDAIHAATSELEGCSTFVTNDSRFSGQLATPAIPLPTVTQ
jgi:predicted nucleic acid-binding protein